MTDHTLSDAPVPYAIGDLHGEVTLLRRLLATLPVPLAAPLDSRSP